jgi:hypothetical protein
MGWRHKRLGSKETAGGWTAALPARGRTAGMKPVSLPDELIRMNPVLPPRPRVDWYYQQVGYFRGKRIFETGLRVHLYLQ